MEFSKLVAVTGMPGIYEIINTRQDGMIVKSLDTAKTQFVSSRIHGFSVLETISMYTEDIEGIMLIEVFRRMKAREEAGQDIIAPKSSKAELLAFFGELVPNFDVERVYPSDVKKVIKWYNLVKPFDVIYDEVVEESNEADSTDEAVTTE